MIIDRILYINLDRRTDRKQLFLDRLEKSGAPMEIVDRLSAKDWQDYLNAESLMSAMHQDGVAVNFDIEHVIENYMSHYAYVWSYTIAYFQVFNRDQNTLILQDDIHLLRPWSDFSDAVDTIDADDHIFLAQAFWREWPEPRAHLTYNRHWQYGIAGVGDKAVLCTKQGARRILAITQSMLSYTMSTESALLEFFNNKHTLHISNGTLFWETIPELGNDSDISGNYNGERPPR